MLVGNNHGLTGGIMEHILFGERLANARKAANMTQDEMAGHLGVRVTTVKDWEAGEVDPRANRLQMIASLLNVPLLWLLGGSQKVPDYSVHGEARDLLLKKIDDVAHKIGDLERELRDLRMLAENISGK